MISKNHTKLFVREGDLTKIENYYKAIADVTHTWHCHHRLELTLEGEFAHTREDLIRMGMYYNRPYFELIFLTEAEHNRLHGKAKSEIQLEKMRKAHKGRKLTEEHRKRISEGLRNNPPSEFGKKYFGHYGYSKSKNVKQYNNEKYWYLKHNNKCSWED